MPNISSAEKRVRADKKRRLRNMQAKSTLKTLKKRFETQAKDGSKESTTASYRTLVKKLDQAGQKKILPVNTVARQKSQVARLYAKLK